MDLSLSLAAQIPRSEIKCLLKKLTTNDKRDLAF